MQTIQLNKAPCPVLVECCILAQNKVQIIWVCGKNLIAYFYFRIPSCEHSNRSSTL
jgi:hypothetical protein